MEAVQLVLIIWALPALFLLSGYAAGKKAKNWVRAIVTLTIISILIAVVVGLWLGWDEFLPLWITASILLIIGYVIGRTVKKQFWVVSALVVISLIIPSFFFVTLQQVRRNVSETDDKLARSPGRPKMRPPTPNAIPQPLPKTRFWPDDATELQRALDSLPLGQVIFHYPNQMEIRKAETAQVRISGNLTDDIAKGLSSQGVVERDQIRISTFMKVSLSGYPYFDVKAINDDEKQPIAKDEFTEWSFTVLPLKPGRWPLHLVITAVVRTPSGAEAYRDYPVKDEFVTVHVTTLGAIESFIFDNWQWLWTTILIPLTGWFWGRRRKAKKTIYPPHTIHTGKIRRRAAS